jgi:hypothetical protein
MQTLVVSILLVRPFSVIELRVVSSSRCGSKATQIVLTATEPADATSELEDCVLMLSTLSKQAMLTKWPSEQCKQTDRQHIIASRSMRACTCSGGYFKLCLFLPSLSDASLCGCC